jgi:N6-L-threonylcarbamoyladenine synthase
MIILGIETSCDETAASVIEVKDSKVTVLSNIISSQIALHAKWGGVVPNLAAREHLKNILPVIETALEKSKKKPTDLDLITVTNGPGLIPALLVGTTTAKTLSYLWKKPLIGIHHIEGHIYANFISDKINALQFPILCLVVSGGHTQLVLMQKHLNYEIIGETVDDAVGEAFDKVARILGLGYPGGPAVAKIADDYSHNLSVCPEEVRTDVSLSNPRLLVKHEKQSQNEEIALLGFLSGKCVSHNLEKEKKFRITLPRPMLKSNNFNFSFSGIKTAVLYATKKNSENLDDKNYIAEMCQEFQTAVTDVLVSKTIRAAKKYNPKIILLAGGVSANVYLRKRLELAVKENLENTSCLFPEPPYSLDNAAMIAMAGYFRWKKIKNKKRLAETWQNLKTNASLKM